MFFQSQKPVYKRSFIDKYIAALSTVPGSALIGATPKIHLFSGSLIPSMDNVLADFTALECNFTGYVASVFTVVGGPFNGDLHTRVLLGSAAFYLTGLTITQNANGYWLDAGTTPDWIVAERFPSPIPFSFVGDVLILNPMIPQIGIYNM